MRRALMVGIVVGLSACRPSSVVQVEPRADASSDANAAVNAPAPPAAPPAADAPPNAPLVVTDWCIDGMTPLDEDVCYLLPALREGPRRLLVYLHGIVPPTAVSVQKQTVQGAVLAAATRAGAAAIVPRGRRGIGPKEAHDWYAWPTDPATHAQLVKEIVARWIAAKKKLEGIAGAAFARTYLAGSSNGAYFLSALAMRGDCDALGFPIDGYGAMSGGAPGGRAPSGPPRPLYIGYGAYDSESKGGARALAAVATAAHWPVRLAEHPFGHGAREVYLDEGFVFWDAAR